MTASFRDWQPGHLHLAAPSLLLLLNGPDHDATDVLGVALRELVGRGLLVPSRIQAGSGENTVHTVAFSQGQPAPDDLERSLRSVLDAHAAANAREGMVTVQELARALRAAHDGELAQWVEDDVVAVLIDRRMIEHQEGKRLGIIPTSSNELTDDGRANQAQIKRSVKDVGTKWDDWASNDPQRAQTFLNLAGSGVLLVPDIAESVRRFRAKQTDDANYPAGSVGTAKAQQFDIDRLALYADELDLMDTVVAHLYLDVDHDDDPSTPR